jgi:hypothetical protein
LVPRRSVSQERVDDLEEEALPVEPRVPRSEVIGVDHDHTRTRRGEPGGEVGLPGASDAVDRDERCPPPRVDAGEYVRVAHQHGAILVEAAPHAAQKLALRAED